MVMTMTLFFPMHVDGLCTNVLIHSFFFSIACYHNSDTLRTFTFCSPNTSLTHTFFQSLIFPLSNATVYFLFFYFFLSYLVGKTRYGYPSVLFFYGRLVIWRFPVSKNEIKSAGKEKTSRCGV
jgi:hypothetical protein